MTKLTIKDAKIWQTGSGTAIITIPRFYIKNGQLRIGQTCNIEIEVENEQNSNNIAE